MTDTAYTKDQICGRDYKTQAPGTGGKVTRFVVDGITHPKGLPIRFKSRKRAENHIRNMRLSLKD